MRPKTTMRNFIQFSLMQKIDYLASDGNRMDEVLTVCSQSDVGSQQAHTMNRFRTSLLIPPTSPTDESSNVCKVQHILKVCLAFSIRKWCINEYFDIFVCFIKIFGTTNFVEVPITIGTFPFVDASNASTQPTPMPYGFVYQPGAPSEPLPQISAPGPLSSSSTAQLSAVADGKGIISSDTIE